jgi:hypothetical protein
MSLLDLDTVIARSDTIECDAYIESVNIERVIYYDRDSRYVLEDYSQLRTATSLSLAAWWLTSVDRAEVARPMARSSAWEIEIVIASSLLSSCV